MCGLGDPKTTARLEQMEKGVGPIRVQKEGMDVCNVNIPRRELKSVLFEKIAGPRKETRKIWRMLIWAHAGCLSSSSAQCPGETVSFDVGDEFECDLCQRTKRKCYFPFPQPLFAPGRK